MDDLDVIGGSNRLDRDLCPREIDNGSCSDRSEDCAGFADTLRGGRNDVLEISSGFAGNNPLGDMMHEVDGYSENEGGVCARPRPARLKTRSAGLDLILPLRKDGLF
jgi:hypothetical protein